MRQPRHVSKPSSRGGNTNHGSGCDPRMMLSCFEAPARGQLGRPGPGYSVEDNPARAAWIEQIKERRVRH